MPRITLPLLVLLVLALGCGGGGSLGGPTTAVDDVDAPSAGPSEPSPELSLSGETDVFTLAGVDSYRERAGVSFSEDGSDEGPTSWVDLEAAYLADPPSEHLVLSTFVGDVETIRIGTRQWIKLGETGWRELPSGGEAPTSSEAVLFGPTQLEAAAEVLDFVGLEVVNGRETMHFRGGTEAVRRMVAAGDGDLDPSNIEEGRVDVWVDPAGFAVLVETELRGRGVAGAEGTATMTASYEVYDFDASIEIAPPTG